MQGNQELRGILRPPNPDELRSFNSALEGCGATLPANYTLLVHELSYREVYVFSDTMVLRVAEQLSVKRNVYFAGIFAGSFRRGRFRLGLDLAEHLYRLGRLSSIVEVNYEEEQRFLYGRDLEGLTPRENLSTSGTVVVVNGAGDVLGLGRYDERSGRLANLVDKGWYLRRGH
ncbi:hypothetical protein B9Q06_03965 [Candidatus Marsarchaeota G2 archaeon ECH_B_2]|uniref:UPF0113 domain-containing protein n=3 Tax=Candidatus Marsarchaeota group 2 TaxID=2203771 RepID=A0A2R6BBG9_9ARCH|nr:MAG: hypothetical protein B9Q06_03965 [Candidatus Marsarchaeota G2 archaeon ECH_B_2]PSO00748.1 MAG: hypothetical protein B9Q07_02795 [Candidatus Marsarchaeota G2 archaeon ECH_B_3]PSO02526.1 MAG: hypothetical protein B9Q05_04535 [Candidatus Marsarchaeota G2 archaeon ECH_B_1]